MKWPIFKTKNHNGYIKLGLGQIKIAIVIFCFRQTFFNITRLFKNKIDNT